MIGGSDLKDGLDVHLHPAVAGKELAAEALWDAVRRVLRGKNISCLILSFFLSLFVFLSLSLYFKPSSGAPKMHCFKYSAKEISSFSILFCEGDSDQRAVQQACKESAKFFSAPWHAGSRPGAPRAVQDVVLHMG